MSANGTAQGYLASQRQSSAPSNYRDNSMAQDNTNSGNPYGYAPPANAPGRYVPPMFDQASGQWNGNAGGTGGLAYSVPTAYTPYQGGLPTGPSPAPYGMYGQRRGPSVFQQQGGQGYPGQPASNALPAQPMDGTKIGQNNGFVSPQIGGNDTYMQSPPGAHSTEPPPKKNYMYNAPGSTNTYTPPAWSNGINPQPSPGQNALNAYQQALGIPKGVGSANSASQGYGGGGLGFQAPPGTPGGWMPPKPGSQGGGASGFMKPNILGMPSGLMPGIPGFGGDGMTQWEKSTRPPVTNTSGIIQRNNDPYGDNTPMAPADPGNYNFGNTFPGMPNIRQY